MDHKTPQPSIWKEVRDTLDAFPGLFLAWFVFVSFHYIMLYEQIRWTGRPSQPLWLDIKPTPILTWWIVFYLIIRVILRDALLKQPKPSDFVEVKRLSRAARITLVQAKLFIILPLVLITSAFSYLSQPLASHPLSNLAFLLGIAAFVSASSSEWDFIKIIFLRFAALLLIAEVLERGLRLVPCIHGFLHVMAPALDASIYKTITFSLHLVLIALFTTAFIYQYLTLRTKITLRLLTAAIALFVITYLFLDHAVARHIQT